MTTLARIEANRRNAQQSTGPRTAEGKAVSRLNAVSHGVLSRLEVLPGLERAEDWQEHLDAILDDLAPVGYLEQTLAERVALTLWRLGRIARFEREAAAVAWENAEAEPGRAGHPADDESLPDARRMAAAEARRLTFVSGLSGLPDAEAVKSQDAAYLVKTLASAAEIDIYGDPNEEGVNFPDYPHGVPLEHMRWTAGYLRRCLAAIADAAEMTLEVMLQTAAEAGQRRLEKAKGRLAKLERAMEQRRRRCLLPPVADLEKVHRYEPALERSLYRALHELQRLQAARQSGGVPAPVAVDVTIDGVPSGA